MDDRRTVVTGGDRGIGLGIATDRAERGETVAICGRDREALATARAGLLATGARHVLAIEADLADPGGAQSVLDALLDHSPDWHALVHSAGNPPAGGLPETDTNLWDATMSIHVRSALVLARGLAPGMTGAGFGRIITISSTAGEQAYRGHVAYCSAKAALEMLTRTLALELGGTGITANSIAPTVILTKLGQQVWGAHPEKADWIRNKIPVGRLGEVSDVVAVARFLLSEESGFVNGARIPCDGGLNVTQADGPPVAG